jgi:hypothetical protein
MSKICECCRSKLMAEFEGKNLPPDVIEGFIEVLEKAIVNAVGLNEIKEPVENYMEKV